MDPTTIKFLDRRKSPLLKNIVYVFVVILISDFVSANIYKFFMGYAWTERAAVIFQSRERLFRRLSKIYHHDLAKKVHVPNALWGNLKYEIFTNSLGFKDKSYREVPLVSISYRIVFIGDSFTEGIGMDYPNTFVGLIDKELSKKGIEVLNAGVNTYSPIIYWRKVKYLIEELGLQFNELVVFLDISDAEDDVKNYTLDDQGNVILLESSEPVAAKGKTKNQQGKLKNFIKTNSFLTYHLLNMIYDFLSSHQIIARESRSNLTRGTWTFDKTIYDDWSHRGLEKMETHMDKLYELLNKHHIKLTVAVYPWPSQIYAGDLNSVQVQFWKKWCAQHHVNFINYFSYFVKGNAEKERLQLIDQYFIEDDVHWNKRGHQMIANIFLSHYTEFQKQIPN